MATPAIPVISSKQRTEPDLRVSTGLVTATANLFGAWEQVSGTGFLFTAPEIVWKAFLGIYMTFWGFREEKLTAPAPLPRPASRHGGPGLRALTGYITICPCSRACCRVYPKFVSRSIPTSTARGVFLLGVDQEFGERPRPWVPLELADAVGAIEVGEHQDVKSSARGAGCA